MAKLEIKEYESFEGIKQIGEENTNEHWLVSDLNGVLEYSIEREEIRKLRNSQTKLMLDE